MPVPCLYILDVYVVFMIACSDFYGVYYLRYKVTVFSTDIPLLTYFISRMFFFLPAFFLYIRFFCNLEYVLLVFFTFPLLLRARDTVAIDTPAKSAISLLSRYPFLLSIK